MNTVIDDELQEINNEVNGSKTTDEDYNGGDEDDNTIVIEGESGKVKKKHTHQEFVGAFDTIQSFMEDEKLPLDRRLALDRLWYGVQMHQMHKPKASPTIRKFFQPICKV